eukprot:6607971-Lingulodinium_polyedra.AAC.1
MLITATLRATRNVPRPNQPQVALLMQLVPAMGPCRVPGGKPPCRLNTACARRCISPSAAANNLSC